MYRALAALALPLLLAVPGSRAFAAPSNAPTAQVIYGTCDGHAVTVISNSGNAGNNGNQNSQQWTPGFISGDGKVIPLSFTFTLLENGMPQFSQTTVKGNGNARGPAAGTPVTCTFSQTATQDGNNYEFDIVVQGVELP